MHVLQAQLYTYSLLPYSSYSYKTFEGQNAPGFFYEQ